MFCDFSARKKKDENADKTEGSVNDCSLLPPPLHVGRYMREKRIDFQLPYDVYWLHKYNLVSKSANW